MPSRPLSLTLAALLGLGASSGARAQCTTVPSGFNDTVVDCPGGGVSVLHTGPTGVTTGQIHGQVFVGTRMGPGVVAGTLGGAPYNIFGGVSPEPPAPIPFLPPPPTILAAPSPADPWPPPSPFAR
jgi:hypothetical protein